MSIDVNGAALVAADRKGLLGELGSERAPSSVRTGPVEEAYLAEREGLVRSLHAALAVLPEHWVSLSVLDYSGADRFISRRGSEVRSLASVGQVLLLLDVAKHRLVAEGRSGDYPVADVEMGRSAVPPVGGSGIWQHLVGVESMPSEALAVLVGQLSDNLATNVLLHHSGIDAVNATAEGLGLTNTRLHDFVRDGRGPDDPAVFATGTTDELLGLMVKMSISSGVTGRALKWIETDGIRPAMGQRFDEGPERPPFGGAAFCHEYSKTGTDAGVRAVMGLVDGPVDALAYALVVNWPGAEESTETRSMVSAAVNEVVMILQRWVFVDRDLSACSSVEPQPFDVVGDTEYEELALDRTPPGRMDLFRAFLRRRWLQWS